MRTETTGAPLSAQTQKGDGAAWARTGRLAACVATALFLAPGAALAAGASAERSAEPSHAIVVRSTENVTQGGWVWLLNEAKAAGVARVDILAKQDEDDFDSVRTGRKLQSGELLVSLPEETTAEGWEDSSWLVEMIERGDQLGVETWAWWPTFHDAQVAARFPDAAYVAGDGSTFVDAASGPVRDRQEQLLRKLVRSYDFDGVSLDWLRYDAITDGGDGPLAERFHARFGAPWSPERMSDPLARAIWGDLRAASIAEWVGQVVAWSRSVRPRLRWGAYLLPPQFKESSQSYPRLTAAGLDVVQPMIYWRLWGKRPEWTAETLRDRAFWRGGARALRPTLDINDDETELKTALRAIGREDVAGVAWYLHGEWTRGHFEKLKRISDWWREDPSPHAADGPISEQVRAGQQRMVERLSPAVFPPNAMSWTLVCLAELYDRGALGPEQPAAPVLALHGFADAPEGGGRSIWVNSSAYLDRLMGFLAERKFSVVPLSRLQAYMIDGDGRDLPPRPLVLTIDDGAGSVLELFHSRAAKHGFPYAVSIITDRGAAERNFEGEYEADERPMTWEEVDRLVSSGLVELASHSHGLHEYVPKGPDAAERGPSLTSRLWLDQSERPETGGEHRRRIFNDLALSREILRSRLGQSGAILAWPYGEYDETAERAALAAGFTHFLLFEGGRFAVPTWSPRRIPRLSITREDEALPLALPEDRLAAQRWWLAFLIFARKTASAPLIEATLAQLDETRLRHPEAEVSRAALDALRGRPETALRRIRSLRSAYPDDPEVLSATDELLTDYQGAF